MYENSAFVREQRLVGVLEQRRQKGFSHDPETAPWGVGPHNTLQNSLVQSNYRCCLNSGIKRDF